MLCLAHVAAGYCCSTLVVDGVASDDRRDALQSEELKKKYSSAIEKGVKGARECAQTHAAFMGKGRQGTDHSVEGLAHSPEGNVTTDKENPVCIIAFQESRKRTATQVDADGEAHSRFEEGVQVSASSTTDVADFRGR